MRFMDMDNILGQIANSMRANSLTSKCMDKVPWSGKIRKSMKFGSMMISDMVREYQADWSKLTIMEELNAL